MCARFRLHARFFQNDVISNEWHTVAGGETTRKKVSVKKIVRLRFDFIVQTNTRKMLEKDIFSHSSEYNGKIRLDVATGKTMTF